MWTSSASMAMIAIVAHHVSKTGEAKDCLLVLKQVESNHSGANMAEAIAPVIKEYGLQDRVGYFVLDNVKSHDTCVRELIDRLQLNRDPKQYRLRCFGHIVNLAVRAFVYGKIHVETAEEELSFEQLELELEQSGPEVVDLAVIKKLQKVVNYIRESPQRREAFKKLSSNDVPKAEKGLNVISDNQTRWNSTFLMLERALKLQSQIRVYN